jgi:hypothetical protein
VDPNRTMNAATHTAPDPVALVEIIELKWLMAGVGVRVHVERLQSEPAYALQTLALAEASPHSALRHLAGRLRTKLQLQPG